MTAWPVLVVGALGVAATVAAMCDTEKWYRAWWASGVQLQYWRGRAEAAEREVERLARDLSTAQAGERRAREDARQLATSPLLRTADRPPALNP